MVRGLWTGLLGVVASFGILTSASAAQFSADMISEVQGQVVQSKIAVKDLKSRVEMPQAIVIQRGDLGVSWMIMANQGMYMEQPLDPKILAQVEKNVEGEVERVPLGRENVNGQSTEKFKVTYFYQGMKQSMFQWIGPKEIPIKVAALDGTWSVEYRNVKTGGVSDALFEVPAGYRKFQMPSMGQLLGTSSQGNN